MADNPYINKQDWGRDLLNRLNNLLSENGSLNHWTEPPVVGPDGDPLGPQHEGLTGLLLGKETEIQTWNGTSWDSLFRVPIEISGDPVPSASVTVESFNPVVLDPGIDSEFLFVVETTNTQNSILVKRYNKLSGALAWQSSATTRAAHNYFFTQVALPGMPTFCIDANNVYISGIEFPSTASVASQGYASIFAFRQSDGAFLWRSEVVTAANQSFYFIGLRSDNNNLYFVQRFTNTIFRLNAISGALLGTHSYTVIVGTSTADIFLDPINNKVVYWIRNPDSGKPVIYSSPTDLSTSSVLLDFNAASGYEAIEASNLLWHDPSNSAIFYFHDITAAGTGRIWRYNSLNNVAEIFASFPSADFFYSRILGIKKEGSTLVLFTANQSIVNTYTFIEGGGFIETSLLTPYGEGVIEQPRGLRVTKQSGEQFFVRQTQLTKGLIASRTISSTIYLSKGGQRLVFLLNSVISNTERIESIKAGFNCSDLFADKISSSRVLASRIACDASASATQTTAPIIPDVGIDIGANLGLFAFNGTGAFSAESKGYTGGGTFVGGIAWGCQPLHGRIVQHRSNTLFAGISLFDQSIGKFFVQVAPAQTVQTVIPTFPNGLGLVLDSSNNLGIGTQSPAFKTQVIGTLSATEVRNSGGVVTSDPRMKLNIASLSGEDCWEIINLLDAISFVYKPDFTVTIEEVTQDENGNDVLNQIEQHWPLPQGIQLGYNAAQIEKILPELVQLEPKSKIKYLNSGAIAPIVHQGTVWKINQLQQIIEQQQTLIESLTARVEALENAA